MRKKGKMPPALARYWRTHKRGTRSRNPGKRLGGLPWEAKERYIDHGFFQVTEAEAKQLAGRLPRHGYERKVSIAGADYWLTRTPRHGRMVWSIRRANPRGGKRSASQFIREEMRSRGKRSRKQAIAIGLSRARAAGVKVPARNPRARKRTSSRARRNPSGGREMIYPEVVAVLARKDPREPHHCDAACKRAHHTFEHRFKPGTAVYGNPDGSQLIIERRRKR